MKRAIKEPLFSHGPSAVWLRDETEQVDWLDATALEQHTCLDVDFAAAPLDEAAKSQPERG